MKKFTTTLKRIYSVAKWIALCVVIAVGLMADTYIFCLIWLLSRGVPD
jgi:hypothetical protein